MLGTVSIRVQNVITTNDRAPAHSEKIVNSFIYRSFHVQWVMQPKYTDFLEIFFGERKILSSNNRWYIFTSWDPKLWKLKNIQIFSDLASDVQSLVPKKFMSLQEMYKYSSTYHWSLKSLSSSKRKMFHDLCYFLKLSDFSTIRYHFLSF